MQDLGQAQGQTCGEDKSWELPKKYKDMTPAEQGKALRSSALIFLQQNGPASVTKIKKEIGAPNSDTLRKALDYLAYTSAIYKESWGGRDTIYFPNGRLAHPLFQGKVRCGSYKEYIISTYIDRLTGKNLTIKEFTVSPSGHREAKGGIRIDLVDLDNFISELKQIRDRISESNVLDRGLVSEV